MGTQEASNNPVNMISNPDFKRKDLNFISYDVRDLGVILKMDCKSKHNIVHISFW